MFRWRRLLCLLLVLSLLFSISVGTAHASASAGVLTIVSSGGAMGTGVGSFVAAALPILPYILVGGIVVYSAVALADDLDNIFASLSFSSQAELEAITTSGVEEFVMSESLSSELESVVSDYYFGASSDFATDGYINNWQDVLTVTHDVNSYKNTYETSGNVLTNNLHSIPLTTRFNSIPGTPFMVRIGEPLPDGMFYNSTIEIYNFATGAGALIGCTEISTYLKNFNKDCISMYVSAPYMYISSVGAPHKSDYYSGLSFLAVCNLLASGLTCSNHSSTYFSRSIPIDMVSNQDLCIYGTGNPAIDGYAMSKCTYDTSTDVYRYYYNDVYEMDTTYTTSASHPLESICVGEVINRVYDNAFDFPSAGTAMYLPTADALADANSLTRTGSLTGEWDIAVEDNPSLDDTVTGEGEGTNSGFWNTLWDWLARILEAIKSIPTAIWQAINSLISAITGSIISALTTVFVPSDAFFDAYFADLAATFDGRLGILTYPSSVIYDFFNSFLSIGETEPILTWEAWEYQGTAVIPAGSYNLNDVLDYHPVFRTIHDIYLIIVDASLVIALLRMLQRKYNSIIQN